MLASVVIYFYRWKFCFFFHCKFFHLNQIFFSTCKNFLFHWTGQFHVNMGDKKVVTQYRHWNNIFICRNLDFSISWRTISLFLIVSLFCFCFLVDTRPKASISAIEFILLELFSNFIPKAPFLRTLCFCLHVHF